MTGRQRVHCILLDGQSRYVTPHIEVVAVAEADVQLVAGEGGHGEALLLQPYLRRGSRSSEENLRGLFDEHRSNLRWRALWAVGSPHRLRSVFGRPHPEQLDRLLHGIARSRDYTFRLVERMNTLGFPDTDSLKAAWEIDE